MKVENLFYAIILHIYFCVAKFICICLMVVVGEFYGVGLGKEKCEDEM